ncbi:hypothetical protein vBAbaPP1_173 [Acinetobacter phage vB_AbaM_P1]|nr:hypothetical protein vBAbaPP1_173 [Acinetobacter phage vB_AbaM_P1]
MLKNIVLTVFYVLIYSLIMACLLSVKSNMWTAYIGVYMVMIVFTIVFINLSMNHISMTISQISVWMEKKWN